MVFFKGSVRDKHTNQFNEEYFIYMDEFDVLCHKDIQQRPEKREHNEFVATRDDANPSTGRSPMGMDDTSHPRGQRGGLWWRGYWFWNWRKIRRHTSSFQPKFVGDGIEPTQQKGAQ